MNDKLTGKLGDVLLPIFFRPLIVPADGMYAVTLDLHVAGDYTYTLQPASVP